MPVLAFVLSVVPVQIFYAFLVLVAGLMIWSTIAARDLWPFSHYPMFGGATEAKTIRFFRLRVFLKDGSSLKLKKDTDVLVDPLHRECDALWAKGSFERFAADELVRRYWREACALDRLVTGAVRLEIVLRIAQVLPGDKIAVMEKTVHVVSLDGP